MTQAQRQRLFDVLVGEDGHGVKVIEELVTEDLDAIEPIIDEMLREAARTGFPKPC